MWQSDKVHGCGEGERLVDVLIDVLLVSQAAGGSKNDLPLL